MDGQSAFTVEITDTQEYLDVDTDRLEEIVHAVLRDEELAAAHISMALVDNAIIHELNRQFLNHDYETDVLSFLFESEPEFDAATWPEHEPYGRGRQIEGEIVISAEMAEETGCRLCLECVGRTCTLLCAWTVASDRLRCYDRAGTRPDAAA